MVFYAQPTSAVISGRLEKEEEGEEEEEDGGGGGIKL